MKRGKRRDPIYQNGRSEVEERPRLPTFNVISVPTSEE